MTPTHGASAIVLTISVLKIRADGDAARPVRMIRRPASLWPDEATDRTRLGLAVGAAPIVVHAVAMAVTDASAPLSTALYFAVPMLYFLLVTLLRAQQGTQAGPRPWPTSPP